MEPVNVALIQLEVDDRFDHNMAQALTLARTASSEGAGLVVLPESFCGIADRERRAQWAAPADAPERARSLTPLCALTREFGNVVVAGGVPEASPDGRLWNTAFVVAQGRVVGRYRKLHLFDASPEGSPPLFESESTRPGHELVVVHASFGTFGLSICYDLRFPELYRRLSRAGAEILLVPAAFTAQTGPAHWEPLLRARAIENQAFVLAPGLTGPHGLGRASHGHSLVVDPWGRVVAGLGQEAGILRVQLDPSVLVGARSRLPALEHRRVEDEMPLVEVSLS